MSIEDAVVMRNVVDRALTIIMPELEDSSELSAAELAPIIKAVLAEGALEQGAPGPMSRIPTDRFRSLEDRTQEKFVKAVLHYKPFEDVT